MQDSKSQSCATGFLKSAKTQLLNVGRRIAQDTGKTIFSQKGELNVLATVGVIAAGVVLAPWAFTAIGVLTVASAALEEQPTSDPAAEQPTCDPAAA